MELNKIYLGDAYKLIKEIPDKSIDLIYTDPPYDFHSGSAVSGGIFKDRECKPYQDVVDAKLNVGIDNSILDEFVRILKHIYIYMVQQVSNSVLSKLLLNLSKYKFRDSNMA